MFIYHKCQFLVCTGHFRNEVLLSKSYDNEFGLARARKRKKLCDVTIRSEPIDPMMNLDGGSYDCDGIHEHSAKIQLDLMESMNNTEIGGSYTSQLE